MNNIIFRTFTILSLLLAMRLNAQESDLKLKNGRLGFTFNTYSDNVIVDNNNNEGGVYYSTDDYFYTIGVNYVYPLKKWLDFETGIEYTKQGLILEYDHITSTSVFSVRKTASMSMVNIPITWRVNFLKYFFINAGAIIDIDSSLESPISNQSGLGIVLGLGLKYDFKSGFSVFVNPLSKIHSVIPLISTNSHSRIFENSFRFGLSYDLSKLGNK